MDSIQRLTIAFWVAGIALVAALVVYADVAEVLRSVAVIGWSFGLVLMIRIVLLAVDSQSWRCLVAHAHRPDLLSAVFQRWVGESVSTLLPFAAIGGELARVRICMLGGLTGALAFASIIVDGVVALISQFLFLCIGIALFIETAAGDETFRQSIFVGSGSLLIAVFLVWLALRGGVLGRLAGVLKTDLASERVIWLADAMGSVDARITQITDDLPTVVRAVLWRLLGWVLGATEIWLILSLLGHPISAAEALILDALTGAVRTAFFFVPGGLVVQEGALLAVGAVLGLPTEAILIAAVIKRGREIFFSIPGLLAWEWVESSRWSRSGAEG